MSFKLRYDELRENDPTQVNPETVLSHEYYAEVGHARNLCLVWPDGRQMFFNYAYLLSGELLLEDEQNVILLYFASYRIQMKGYRLEGLFTKLLEHLPRLIRVTDARYIEADNTNNPLVTEIITEKKEA